MAETIKEERLRWVLPIMRKEVHLVDAARMCPYSKRSLERWVAAYKSGGETALEPRSTAPKTQPHETSIATKEGIVTLRKETRLCALKLHWRLKKRGTIIPVRTIGKILKTALIQDGPLKMEQLNAHIALIKKHCMTRQSLLRCKI